MGERLSLVLTGLGTTALAGRRFLTCLFRRGRAFLRGSYNPLGLFPCFLQAFLLQPVGEEFPPGVAPLGADRTTNVRRTGTALRAVYVVIPPGERPELLAGCAIWVNLSRETTVKTVHGNKH